MLAKYAGTCLLLVAVVLLAPRPAVAQIDCSAVFCTAADQNLIGGYPMFNESNFSPIVDGFGRTRRFWVHVPVDYDVVNGINQKIPLVFAFHGGGQNRQDMVDGKWGDYFDQEIAFVIPLGEPDPCDNPLGNGGTQWLLPGLGASTSAGNPNCDAASQVVDVFGAPLTYWNASLSGAFTDVLFVEALRTMVLSRFPKLNSEKVYATGFSSGGGMTLALACYRSAQFRGFSVVGRTLAGDNGRGDYDGDGVVETDPNSLLATCGKSVWDPGHATGIVAPNIWGYGVSRLVVTPNPPFVSPVYLRVAKPVALFVGDQDRPMVDINGTGNEIRARNNLTGGFLVLNPFQDIQADDATTQRRTFTTATNAAQASAAFRRYLVQGIAGVSGGHSIPDASECPPVPYDFNTCDYNYTDETITFFETHADLSLNP